jgi:hypothetical protein
MNTLLLPTLKFNKNTIDNKVKEEGIGQKHMKHHNTNLWSSNQLEVLWQ